MVSRRLWSCLLIATVCASASGCAVYDPYTVWRYSFDYNTERQFSFNSAGYDHLPPRIVRLRLTKWAYNPGPSPLPSTMVIPDDAPIAPDLAPPLPPPASPSSEEIPQPLPAARPGPSAAWRHETQAVSHQSPRPTAGNPPVNSGAWLYARP